MIPGQAPVVAVSFSGCAKCKQGDGAADDVPGIEQAPKDAEIGTTVRFGAVSKLKLAFRSAARELALGLGLGIGIGLGLGLGLGKVLPQSP